MKTYTKKQREGIAQAFREAKKLLWDGRHPRNGLEYICIALDQARVAYAQMAQNEILRRLNAPCPYYTVYTWLRDVLKVPQEDLTDLNVQTFRHRWVAALIKEFSQ